MLYLSWQYFSHYIQIIEREDFRVGPSLTFKTHQRILESAWLPDIFVDVQHEFVNVKHVLQ